MEYDHQLLFTCYRVIKYISMLSSIVIPMTTTFVIANFAKSHSTDEAVEDESDSELKDTMDEQDLSAQFMNGSIK